jgi:hypothetical protein
VRHVDVLQYYFVNNSIVCVQDWTGAGVPARAKQLRRPDAGEQLGLLKNLAKSAPAASLAAMKAELHQWYACAGSACP